MKINQPFLAVSWFFIILMTGCATRIHDVILGESINEVSVRDVRYAVYSKNPAVPNRTLYLLLAPAGYSGEDYLRKWVSLIGHSKAVLIAPDLGRPKISPKELSEQIREFILAEAERYQVSKNQLLLIGESNGAVLGFELIDHFPDLFRASVMISGAIDQRILEELISDAKAVKTQILIVHGTDDPVFKIDSMKKNYELLTNAGVTVELRVVPGMGHGSDIFTDEEVVSWLKTKITQ